MSAIYILWLRQLKRYFRARVRILSSLGQPVLFLISLGFGFGPLYQRAGAGNYLQYLAPGVIAMGILFPSVFSGIEIIWDRQFGFLKETLVAPVSRFQIVLGRTLGGATTALVQGVIVLIICSFAGFRMGNFFLLPVALGFMFLIALLGNSIGTAIGSVVEDVQG
ncbi:MAG: ABC transporter permease, partial [Verrucomicrobia bacterium]|nr:ABC transporter permease [Verrucomicrobiota bacterium]